MTLHVEFTAPQDFDVSLDQGTDFSVSLGQTTIISTAPYYQGDYSVTPKIYEQVQLETKEKLMEDNVTVKKIPQYEVSNEYGGNTLIMGDEYFNGE